VPAGRGQLVTVVLFESLQARTLLLL